MVLLVSNILALAGACATIVHDGIMTPFDGNFKLFKDKSC